MQTPYEMEQEANLFAMYLLMPGEMVKEEIAKIKNFDAVDEEDIKRLAKRFRVSTAIMGIRIGMLITDGK